MENIYRAARIDKYNLRDIEGNSLMSHKAGRTLKWGSQLIFPPVQKATEEDRKYKRQDQEFETPPERAENNTDAEQNA